MAKTEASITMTCKACGKKASGPAEGVKAAMDRHTAKKGKEHKA
jgi:hypothetical protein